MEKHHYLFCLYDTLGNRLTSWQEHSSLRTMTARAEMILQHDLDAARIEVFELVHHPMGPTPKGPVYITAIPW